MATLEQAISGRTAAHVLRQRADALGDEHAFTFLADGELDGESITYAELDRRSRAVAAVLQARGLAGARVLLLYPPGFDYIAGFYGCLYAGAVAVPAYPPLTTRLAVRLRSIVPDCDPDLALTTGELGDHIADHAERLGLENVEALATEGLPDEAGDEWRDGGSSPDELAFIQYSSGSTGDPKGVMVTHENLLDNSRCIREQTYCQGGVGVAWLPPYHDMGLIAGIVQPVYSGFPTVLMSPLSFLQRPLRWLQAISQQDAPVMAAAPNFGYDLCTRTLKDGERDGLDLSRWEVAVSGAEPVRAETIDRFVETFGPCGFRPRTFSPSFGMAEVALMAAGPRRNETPVIAEFDSESLRKGEAAAPTGGASRRLVGCGRPVLGHEIAIVDPETGSPRDERRIGEIWVAGPSVTAGYWGRPEETIRTFEGQIAERDGTRFLRTGDLGFLAGGELFVTGRLKELIVLGGRNHHPHDIEQTAQRSIGGLRPDAGAAFSVEVNGHERAVVVQEVEPSKVRDTGEAIAAIRRAVSEEHGIRLHAVVLVKRNRVPKTTSGKIQRIACRAAFLRDELKVVDRWTSRTDAVLEGERLPEATRWGITPDELSAARPDERRDQLERELLQQVETLIELGAGELGRDDSLNEAGLDSLAALMLKEQIEANLGVTVPLGTLAEGMSVAELATLLAALVGEDSASDSSDGLALAEAVTPEQAAGLLARIDRMDDADVEALLGDTVVDAGARD